MGGRGIEDRAEKFVSESGGGVSVLGKKERVYRVGEIVRVKV